MFSCFSADAICSATDHNKYFLLPTGDSCKTYYQCNNGNPILNDCPNGYAMNISSSQCKIDTLICPALGKLCNLGRYIMNALLWYIYILI